MKVNFNDSTPIFRQIADAIEDDILSGKLKEGDNCYSQIDIARELSINPATAQKGIRLLVDAGELEKVRGQSMVVKTGAVSMIRKKKTEGVLLEMIDRLVTEAKKLGIDASDLIDKVVSAYDEEEK